MNRLESKIAKESFRYIGMNPDYRIFRNNTGMAWQGVKDKSSTPQRLVLLNPRPVKFGLQTGSSDYIFMKRVTITPDMVGKQIAQFGALEFKKPKSGRPTQEQISFVQTVLRMGGLAGFSRSLEDSKTIAEID